MSAEEERELVDKLIKNINLFSWDLYDMPRIDTNMVRHHLVIHPSAKLAVQGKQKVGEEKRVSIN